MMPRQLPNVRTDKGYQEEARQYARNAMSAKFGGILCPPRDLTQLPDWLERVIADAYLNGANSAIGIGYRLADKDWEETVRDYKKQIRQLQEAQQ